MRTLRYHLALGATAPHHITAVIMKFEHLIEINDPLNPLIDTLTMEQLWRGLVLRAESPKLFVPHLDECMIEQRSENGFSRQLRYGELLIRPRDAASDAPDPLRRGGAKRHHRLQPDDDHRNAAAGVAVRALRIRRRPRCRNRRRQRHV